MKIVILTGSEIRHEYFRKKLASEKQISVLTSYCEGDEKPNNYCICSIY